MPYMAERVTQSWANDSLLSQRTPEKGFRSKDGFLAGVVACGLALPALEVLEVLDTPDFWLKLLCALSIVIFSAGLDC